MKYRRYKFRLLPDDEQQATITEWSDTCRAIWNCALEQRKHHYRNYRQNTGKSISLYGQINELTQLRYEFDWIEAVPTVVLQSPLKNLDKAFKAFWDKSRPDAKYPRFKSKHKDGTRITVSNTANCGHIRKVSGRISEIKLPKIKKWFKFIDSRAIPDGAKLTSITVKQDKAGDWWISIAFKMDENQEYPPDSVGLDRGITNAIADSNGKLYRMPENLAKVTRQRKKAQKNLSRKRKGSNRYKAQKRVVARKYRTETNIRNDFVQRTTTEIAANCGTVFLENLRTKDMSRKGRGKKGLNREIRNSCWGLIEHCLGYKAQVFKVDPAYTSQTCASCGHVEKANRNGERFACRNCGHRAHADVNAAVNILLAGEHSVAQGNAKTFSDNGRGGS